MLTRKIGDRKWRSAEQPLEMEWEVTPTDVRRYIRESTAYGYNNGRDLGLQLAR